MTEQFQFLVTKNKCIENLTKCAHARQKESCREKTQSKSLD